MRKCKFTQIMNILELKKNLLNFVIYKPHRIFHISSELGIPDFGFPLGRSLHHYLKTLPAETKL